MKLKKLIEDLNYKVLNGSLDKEIMHITYDSRKVIEGSMFICIKGFKFDGHRFIDDAIERGATTIVVEDEVLIKTNYNITIIQADNTRKEMANIANKFYKRPSYDFNLVGVTGTNGKTTTVYLIEHILKTYGQKVGLIGTIENHIDSNVEKASRTTPESIDLQKLFNTMRNCEVDTTVMEVSSHALDLYRVYGSDYDVGVFTNLSLDHLDYHKTMENYLAAKIKLFKMCKMGIINIDDSVADKIINEATCEEIYTYSTENENAFLFAKNIELSAQGVSFTLVIEGDSYQVKYSTPGKFSVYNSLAAIGACYALNIPIEVIINGLRTVEGVKGRFQTITSSKGYSVIVDYAHAPDGLLNVLKSIREFVKGRIITVFGCGGDRDKSKRPIMGKIAGEYSDFSIITSDNPRTEAPEVIIDEIEAGTRETECPYTKILDRKEAIQFALTMADKQDVILIAGKGHENYQEIGNNKIHFDDIEVVEEFIQGES
ncbi:MAG: UDP-N-acetylmuramoyl-L-alanyl-D-glutamate--2,6-diaminopimelate ligase [Eubacteriales bacterium]